jgi:hypothetical protein
MNSGEEFLLVLAVIVGFLIPFAGKGRLWNVDNLIA